MSNEEFISQVRSYINSTPELLSMLYDLDLMPEQCDEKSLDYRRMLWLTVWHCFIRGNGTLGKTDEIPLDVIKG